MAHTVGMAISVILHNIRSAHNVGSIFRTADGAGVSNIYLSGYTPAPLDRFGRENTEIAKTSLGATHTVPHESVPDIHVLIQKLKVAGATVVAVEQGKDAVDYRNIALMQTRYLFLEMKLRELSPRCSQGWMPVYTSPLVA